MWRVRDTPERGDAVACHPFLAYGPPTRTEVKLYITYFLKLKGIKYCEVYAGILKGFIYLRYPS
jgi:hypothetical protein